MLVKPHFSRFVVLLSVILFMLHLISGTSFANDLFGKKERFLPPHEAFIFSAQADQQSLNLNWQIAEGYYLYQREISLEDAQGRITDLALPPATPYHDEFFGEVQIYRNQLALAVPLHNRNGKIIVHYQGCTSGFCYPPETQELDLAALQSGQNATAIAEDSPVDTMQQSAVIADNRNVDDSFFNRNSTEELAGNLGESKFSILWFFVLGLGLAFTPCVLPMLPLLSSIVIGQKQRPHSLRALLLSVVYIQGMALTYTALGLLVVAIGLPFQIALQSPYVLIAFSILFVVLACSMFGVFNLQLPSSWQNKLNQMSQKQSGGAYWNVFLMGMIAGLVASPCVSAPLSGALLYVAQSGDFVTGGWSLYLLALGMGVPLVLVTLFGNRILPKGGVWQEKVKIAFGFVMLAVPVFLISRLIADIWGERLWSLLGVAFFLWLTSAISDKKSLLGIKLLPLLVAIVLAQPLVSWVGQMINGNTLTSQTESPHLHFNAVSDFADLQQQLQQNSGKVVMLDLYADWCVACKEFEKYTFSDPQVQQQMAQMALLRADLTRNSPQNRTLMENLNIVGLPTIIFFDLSGKEIASSRISGFLDARQFEQWLAPLLKQHNQQ
ncbi:protein-disulfide reductase DsbD [Testudinibacter sp. TR-2022]|uniref:protein-disulfide reductase DsbD n=1 Tax=Testudinibacter sp. TR-2022 TaxID=2585029 RepID=UPI00227956EE|nr:protein-disulfide reductase DsbD [Testudinibacter sp. TR-2022]